MVDFDRDKIFKALLLCNAALIMLYVLTNYVLPVPSWTIQHWFDLDAEKNIPTWFSSMKLISIGFVCYVYATETKKRLLRRFYVIGAFVFAFLSADEVSLIHEGIGGLARKSDIFHAHFHHVELWMLLYPLAALILLIGCWRETLAFLYDSIGNMTLIGGAIVYGVGVLGFESLGIYFIAANQSVINMIEVCFEEGFEMLGQSIMLYAVLIKLDAIRAPGSIPLSPDLRSTQPTDYSLETQGAGGVDCDR